MRQRRRTKSILFHGGIIVVIGCALTIGLALLGAWRSGQRDGQGTSHIFDHGNAVWQFGRERWFGVTQDSWFAQEVLYEGLTQEARASQADYYFEKSPESGTWSDDRKRRYWSTMLRSGTKYLTRVPPRFLGPFDDVAREKLSGRTIHGRQLLVGWPAPAFGCWFPRTSQYWPDPPGVIGGVELEPETYTVTTNSSGLSRVGGRGVAAAPTTRTVTIKRAIPYLPIWPGIAIDVGVLGGGSWLALAMLWWMRSWNRRRRGRCPRCAYDLVGDFASGCSECGWGRS